MRRRFLFGDSIEAHSAAVLKVAQGDRLVVVGCTFELAIAAPDRVAGLVLVVGRRSW
jgi:hypothetical protein